MKNCKCGCSEYITKPKGPHVGAYCKQCGKWLAWLNQALVKERELNEAIKEAEEANQLQNEQFTKWEKEQETKIDNTDCPF